jgi:hypothetical protein
VSAVWIDGRVDHGWVDVRKCMGAFLFLHKVGVLNTSVGVRHGHNPQIRVCPQARRPLAQRWGVWLENFCNENKHAVRISAWAISAVPFDWEQFAGVLPE